MTPQSKLAASTRIANQEMEILLWLKNNHPEVFTEQKYLDADTIERAYWHYGRLSALKDVHPSLAEAQKVITAEGTEAKYLGEQLSLEREWNKEMRQEMLRLVDIEAQATIAQERLAEAQKVMDVMREALRCVEDDYDFKTATGTVIMEAIDAYEKWSNHD